MRRLLAILLAFTALSAIGGGVAYAARPAPAVTFQLVAPDFPASDVQDVAADWSKGTGVAVEVVDSCSGPYCIHAVWTDFACGQAWGGCAQPVGDGSCLVQVATWTLDYGELGILAQLKHEVGHCVWGPVLGYSFHMDLDKAVMDDSFNLRAPPLRLVTQERKLTAEAWSLSG